MKKHKIKLIASLASFAMVVAVMGVGVWAATNQTLNVNTTISFTARNVQVCVKAGVYGETTKTVSSVTSSAYISSADFTKTENSTITTTAEALDKKTSETYATIFETDTQANNYAVLKTSDSLSITLDDNSNGFIPTDETITIVYQVTNKDASNVMYMSFTAPTINEDVEDAFDNLNITYSGFSSAGHGKIGYQLAGNGVGTITITFDVADQDTEDNIPGIAKHLSDTLLTGTAFNFYNGYGSLPDASVVTLAPVAENTGTFTVNDVADTSVTVIKGSTVVASGNTLTIGDTVITATPYTDYYFVEWTGIPANGTISADTTIQARFLQAGLYDASSWTQTADWDSLKSNYSDAFANEGATIQGNADDETSYLTALSGVLIIPNSVTSIGDATFAGCSNLTSILIPSSVRHIGWAAFNDTGFISSLKDTTGTQANPNNRMFKDNGVYYIVCSDDSSKYICIGGSKAHISDLANATGNISILNGTICLMNYAFYNCSELISITIPSDVNNIRGICYGCTGLTTVTIYSDLSSIGDYAFSNCSGLTSITIPDSVTSIGRGAFRKCTGLTSITIGRGVTSIGNWAFHVCSGLATINFSGTIAEWNAITKGVNWNTNVPATVVHCSDGDVTL